MYIKNTKVLLTFFYQVLTKRKENTRTLTLPQREREREKKKKDKDVMRKKVVRINLNKSETTKIIKINCLEELLKIVIPEISKKFSKLLKLFCFNARSLIVLQSRSTIDHDLPRGLD